MDWLPGSAYQYWAVGLAAHALTDCPQTFLWVLAGLEVLVLAGWALARRGPGPRASFWILAALAAAFAWAARDQNFLLGDSRVWIQNAAVAGRFLPADRAPVSAMTLGLLADLTRSFLESQTILALSSVLLGVGTAWMVWRVAAAEAGGTGSRRLAAFAVLALFCTPIGFNFLGHIEAYPLFMFLMAVFLAVLRRDLNRGGSFFPSLLALIVMVFFHYMAALLAVPVLAVLAAGNRMSRRGLVLAYLGLLAAAYVVFAAIPPLREHTLLVRTGGLPAFLDYGWDLLNMWLLLFVPLGLVAWRVADKVIADTFGRILLLTAVTFIVFPVFADFELGGYRDLDLMGPALLALTLFCAVGLARGGGRLPVLGFALGAVFLAGIQTLALCPAGAQEMERHLARRVMEAEARANAEEILAFFYREQGDLARAREHMEGAVTAMPGNRRQWGPLGEVQLALGDTAAAIESLSLAMDSPRAGRTAPLLGEVLTKQGRPREAIAVLESVRDEVLADARGSAALAVAYYEAGMPESTLAVAQERLDIDPRDAVAYYNGASALARLGDGEGALRALTLAVRLDAGNLHYHRQMLRFLLTLPDGAARARSYLAGLDPALADSVTAGR